MRWTAVLCVMAAGPVAAQPVAYPTCIGALQDALRAKSSMDGLLDGHYRVLFSPDSGSVTAPARDASATAKGEIDAALSAYIAALADACEALR